MSYIIPGISFFLESKSQLTLSFFFFFWYSWRISGGKTRLIPTRSSTRARTVIGGKVAKATRTQSGHSSWSSITTRPRALGSHYLYFHQTKCSSLYLHLHITVLNSNSNQDDSWLGRTTHTTPPFNRHLLLLRSLVSISSQWISHQLIQAHQYILILYN